MTTGDAADRASRLPVDRGAPGVGAAAAASGQQPWTPDAEFDRQRDALLDAGYPDLLGIPREQLEALIEPLRALVTGALRSRAAPPTRSTVPFLLVVSGRLARAEDLVPGMRRGPRAGVLDPNHGAEGLAPYRPVPGLTIPPAPVYAVLEVDRGEEFRGVAPEAALEQIVSRGRSPLTIHEGIALVTLHPEVLEKNCCFMLAGSSRGDRRVPAIWISGSAAKLGWCWAGNPHSWLGTASAAGRLP
jgi:hypothetical protein